MGLKYRAQGRDCDYLLKGLLRCPDHGRTLTGDRKKGQYVYYFHAGCEYFREEWILERIDSAMRDLEFSPDTAEKLKEIFSGVVDDVLVNDESEKRTISARISALERENKKLLDLLVNDGIDPTTVKTRMDENRQSVERLHKQYSTLSKNRDSFVLNVKEVIDLTRQIPETYALASRERKIELLRELAECITVSRAGIFIHWHRPYDYIFRAEMKPVRKYPVSYAKRDIVRTIVEEWLAA